MKHGSLHKLSAITLLVAYSGVVGLINDHAIPCGYMIKCTCQVSPMPVYRKTNYLNSDPMQS